MYGTGSDQYRQQAAMTASPAQLVVMLYDGILSEVARGRRALEADPVDHAEVNDCLGRAQAILTELSATIDHERGGQIAANLASLYAFCQSQLIDANIQKSTEPLGSVLDIVIGLRDSWDEACVRAPATAGVAG